MKVFWEVNEHTWYTSRQVPLSTNLDPLIRLVLSKSCAQKYFMVIWGCRRKRNQPPPAGTTTSPLLPAPRRPAAHHQPPPPPPPPATTTTTTPKQHANIIIHQTEPPEKEDGGAGGDRGAFTAPQKKKNKRKAKRVFKPRSCSHRHGVCTADGCTLCKDCCVDPEHKKKITDLPPAKKPRLLRACATMQEGDYKVPSENSSEFEGSVALNCRPCEEKLFEKLLQTLTSTLDGTPLFQQQRCARLSAAH